MPSEAAGAAEKIRMVSSHDDLKVLGRPVGWSVAAARPHDPVALLERATVGLAIAVVQAVADNFTADIAEPGGERRVFPLRPRGIEAKTRCHFGTEETQIDLLGHADRSSIPTRRKVSKQL